MKSFGLLLKRELTAYFLSPIAYLVMMFFLAMIGFSFWLLVSILVQGTMSASILSELFGSIFFWIAVLIVVPVLTMRLFAEERRSGTMETLLTAPVGDAAVVLAKYIGALVFFMLMWVPTLAYLWILRRFSPLEAPPDWGALAGGYLGALLVGAFYLAIGVFCSALTRNQIVAAVMAFAVISVLFFAGFLAYTARDPALREFGAYISSVEYMRDFARGAVDSRAFVFHLSGMLFMLFATVRVLESRQWI
jgi:ABC-2 type transport system permease protein